MTAIPALPASLSSVPTVKNLNAISYAVQFLSNQSLRPTWKVWKSASEAILSKTWTVPLFNTNITFDSDNNAFTANGIANIETQGFYATECCMQVEDLVSTVATWSVAFQITGGTNNPNLTPGELVWYGFRANGTAETTGGAVAGDDALTCCDITPLCLYPGDSIAPIVITSSNMTVDPLENNNFINARFAFVFTGYWIGVAATSNFSPTGGGTPPTTSPVTLGINQDDLANLQAVVPGANAARYYDGSSDGTSPIPTTWPTVTGTNNITLSLRPNLPNLLNETKVADNGSGKTTLGGQIQFLAQQAPPGSKLTIWHEAGNLYGNVNFVTPSNIRSSHVMCLSLCSGTNVSYGQIIYGNITTMDNWIPKTPFALNWYGIDIYDQVDGKFRNSDGSLNQTIINNYLTEYQELAQGRTGLSNPTIDVGESNSPIEAHRPLWFTYVAQWLHANGNPVAGSRMLMFYKAGGPASGPWDPNDTATFTALNAIISNYG